MPQASYAVPLSTLAHAFRHSARPPASTCTHSLSHTLIQTQTHTQNTHTHTAASGQSMMSGHSDTLIRHCHLDVGHVLTAEAEQAGPEQGTHLGAARERHAAWGRWASPAEGQASLEPLTPIVVPLAAQSPRQNSS